ncbi:MAG: OmpA family protein [Saprospiraceae bacterium]|nr:OmpA family protein [Saprospiraceae bacterium]
MANNISAIIICFLVSLSLTTSYAQCPKGDQAYSLLQYDEAIKAYTKCLNKNADNAYLLDRIGDCYYSLGNTVMAAMYYKRLIADSPDFGSGITKYGDALLRNGQHEDYDRFVDSLIAAHPSNKQYARMKTLPMVTQTESQYEVHLAPFNSQSADFSPAFYGNALVFSSSRSNDKKRDKLTGDNFTDLYFFDTISQSVEQMKLPFSTKYNMGAAAFSKDGKTMYFSANQPEKSLNQTINKVFLKIYESTFSKGTWSEPKLFIYNFELANNTHPAISHKGNLLVFSSDINSSMDLYHCIKEKSGYWSKPVKFPDYINTKTGHEVFPTFLNDSTLIFSSNGIGHPGYGLDMYKTVWNGKKWSFPERLSEPFNGQGDDFGLISADDMLSGWFTSNRESSTGHESIYGFYKRLPIAGKDDKKSIAPLLIITGTVNGGGKPLPGALVSVSYSPGNFMKMISDSLGTFNAQWQHDGEAEVEFEVMKPGYHSEHGKALLKRTADTMFFTFAFDLKPIQEDEEITIKNIYYNYNKWDILPDAASELDKLIIYLASHPSVSIELSSHTDARGDDRYNQILSQKRAESARKYLLDNGIEASRIHAIGYGESKPVNHCTNTVKCSEAAHAENRRTEIKILGL